MSGECKLLTMRMMCKTRKQKRHVGKKHLSHPIPWLIVALEDNGCVVARGTRCSSTPGYAIIGVTAGCRYVRDVEQRRIIFWRSLIRTFGWGNLRWSGTTFIPFWGISLSYVNRYFGTGSWLWWVGM